MEEKEEENKPKEPKKTTEHTLTQHLELELTGGIADYSKSKFYGDNQILICSPSNSEIQLKVEGTKCGLVVMSSKEFPLCA